MGTEVKELNRLRRCEVRIERGLAVFVDVGLALAEIRDERLYRADGYDLFPDYCEQRWGVSYRVARHRIVAAQISHALKMNNCSFLPTCEGQTRPLARLEPDERLAVWRAVVDRAPKDRGVPRITAALVKAVVAERAREALEGELIPPSRDVPRASPAQEVADLLTEANRGDGQVCPNCGGQEFDEEGDCRRCFHPCRSEEPEDLGPPGVEPRSAVVQPDRPTRSPEEPINPGDPIWDEIEGAVGDWIAGDRRRAVVAAARLENLVEKIRLRL